MRAEVYMYVSPIRVRALAGVTALCSWARHFTRTVPLSTQIYKWVRGFIKGQPTGNLTGCKQDFA